jgi:hypothetical protein
MQSRQRDRVARTGVRAKAGIPTRARNGLHRSKQEFLSGRRTPTAQLADHVSDELANDRGHEAVRRIDGWWQACDALGAAGYDPFGSQSANFNRLIDAAVRDPVSGTASHRSYLCEIRPAA